MGPWVWWGTPQWIFGAIAIWVIFGRRWSRGRDRVGAERHDALAAEVDDLRRRLADLEGERDRLSEVEDRLDFTERMLSKSGPASSLREEN
ncbi:MAG: hypothetical protein WBC97_07850 [Gemmatimonadales bacterium]